MLNDNRAADLLVHAIVRNWRTAPLENRDRQLCAFAEKLTIRQHGMKPDDLDDLREAGFNDRAIHDAVQVIGYFNYITRLADALGVEPENFIKPWGDSSVKGEHDGPDASIHERLSRRTGA